MKPAPEMHEGSEAWTRFQTAMKAVLSVPHTTVQKQIEEHKKKAALNPRKRGPKSKRKPASHDPAVS